MELRTKVEARSPDFKIDYSTVLMMLGSCFTENIGEKFRYYKFNVDVNPCGIVYNPSSVANALRLLLEGKSFGEEDLLFANGLWHSLYHHGDFSSPDKETCLAAINARLREGRRRLESLDALVITWGTAWVYRHLRSGIIVSNCHKLPAREFERFRLGVDDITREYADLLARLREVNPKTRVLFTVSPIRHWKDGAHGNQLSKATLLLAIEELQTRFPSLYYFPSYEIMMDELRDYRFYNEDMLHVSPLAVNYIWEQFRDTHVSPSLTGLMGRIERVNKGINHRPLNKQPEAHRQFARKLLAEIDAIVTECPSLDFRRERTILQARLREA